MIGDTVSPVTCADCGEIVLHDVKKPIVDNVRSSTGSRERHAIMQHGRFKHPELDNRERSLLADRSLRGR